jgi:Sigma-70, region 4
MKLSELVALRGGSRRLHNALILGESSKRLRIVTLQDYLSAGPSGDALLLSVPGVGRKGLWELHQYIREVPAFKDHEPTLGGESRPSLPLAASQGTRPAIPAVEQSLVHEPIHVDSEATNPERPPAHMVQQDPLASLQVLMPREEQIVQARVMVSGPTLEQLGKVHGLTRQRVRQIEQKALHKLRSRYRTALAAYLEPRASVLWCEATDAHASNDGSLEDRLAGSMTKADSLAAHVLYGKVLGWLPLVARKTARGWLPKAIDRRTHLQLLESVETFVRANPLPRPVEPQRFDSRLTTADLQLVIATSRKWNIWEGYLTPAPTTLRIRRTVRAHKLLLTKLPGHSAKLDAIRSLYVSHYTDDPCSDRDLQIVMQASSHLFLNMYEEGWYAIREVERDIQDAIQPINAARLSMPTASRAILERQTVRDRLVNILRRDGPKFFDEIRNQFINESRGHFSPASVGPTLVNNEVFVRLAPGLYGLRDHLDSKECVRVARRALMEVTSCELYCRARWAGEPLGLYPLWTVDTEYEWVKWAARENLHVPLISLMAIASPSDWPASTKERGRWLRFKRTNAGYMLEDSNPYVLFSSLPSVRELLAISLQARAAKRISWMSANRVCGARLDDRHIHSALALLVSFGILLAPEHWQRNHQYLGHGGFAFTALSHQLMNSLPTAPSALPMKMLQAHSQRVSHFGWVNRAEVTAALASLAECCAATERVVAPPDPGSVGVVQSELEVVSAAILRKRAAASVSKHSDD